MSIKNYYLYFSVLFLISCNNDPCADITCLNGGNCIDGSCDCPIGFTGSECGTTVTPTSITVEEIRVLKYPYLNNSGQPWDNELNTDTGYADLLTVVYDYGASNGQAYQYNANGSFPPNCDPSLTHSFPYCVSSTKFDITNLNGLHAVSVEDEDVLSSGDAIDIIDFYPNNLLLPIPNYSYTFQLSNDSTIFEIDVTYNL